MLEIKEMARSTYYYNVARKSDDRYADVKKRIAEPGAPGRAIGLAHVGAIWLSQSLDATA